MYVHRGNRVEVLVEALAEVVGRPAGDASEPECIVVESRGMERWLSMELARRFGVWANAEFPFPRRILDRVMDVVPAEERGRCEAFEPEEILWSIAGLLRELENRPEFAAVHNYIAGDESAARRLQLAARVANTFDQYAVFRPEMVLDWEGGKGPGWQPMLWRALVARHGARHVAARARGFIKAVEEGRACSGSLPVRVSLFGISTLPPLYLEVLTALARLSEVHLFFLSPSREYWGQIRSRREIRGARVRRGVTRDESAEELYLYEGNPLLASLGRLGRDFQEVLEDLGQYRESERDLYRDPGTKSMLRTIQSDILHLRHRRKDNPDACRQVIDPEDRSIAIHACYSAMREVEVLHDQLLALFDGDPSLQPRDVVVMIPEIDAYAPFVDAVFGAHRRSAAGEPQIPYSISDRSRGAGEDVYTAFRALLDLVQGRVSAPEVVDALAIEAVRRRFGIEAEDLDTVRRWVSETGIRWGVDEAHRRSLGQPALRENTWRFGLDRLLLGYAMSGVDGTSYAGVVPYDDMEGSGTELLGRLASFCESLFASREALQAPLAPDAWASGLTGLLDGMVDLTDQNADQHRRIRGALAALAERAKRTGFQEPIRLAEFRAELNRELSRGGPARRFLSGGVTFCALVPMRSIPFRVVCLVGMNDGAFPRTRKPPDFDLRAERPRAGDRSARDDDRYLYLEALLSARDRLLITYVGQSVRDQKELPPSVVVSELIDTAMESFRMAEAAASADSGEEVRHHLLDFHPLQPFSPRYFRVDHEPRLFSYSEPNRTGARALEDERVPARPFLSAPLSTAGPDDKSVSIDDLAAFFACPYRVFAQRSLGLYLGTDVMRLPDREPLELDSIESWRVGGDLLARSLAGQDINEALAWVRGRGGLPLGGLGDWYYENSKREIRRLAQAVRARTAAARLDPLIVDGRVDGMRITGVLRNLWSDGQVYWQYSKLGGHHEIGVWIRHLVLNWRARACCPRKTVLLGRPPAKGTSVVVRLLPVDNAEEILRELLCLYRLGGRFPLPLFPRTSRTYVEALQSERKDEAGAMAAARAVFVGHRYSPGEREDAYAREVFGGCDPLDPAFPPFEVGAARGDASGATEVSFARLSRLLWEPLLSHRRLVGEGE